MAEPVEDTALERAQVLHGRIVVLVLHMRSQLA